MSNNKNTVQIFTEYIVKLRHISHDTELVREVVEQDVLHLYQRRHPQVVLSSCKCKFQVPNTMYFNQNIMTSLCPYPLQSLVSRLWKSMRWGLYLCMRAQKARPSLQLEDMSLILTPG